MRWLALLVLIVGVGCEPSWKMKRTEVIAAIKECESSGMRAQIVRVGFSGKIIDVECLPKP